MENNKYSSVLSNRLGNNYYIRDLNKEDYNNYLQLYVKQRVSGNVEIETSDEFASYYVTDAEGNILYCKAIAPYTFFELDIATNETLFIYSNNSIKIKKRKYSLNDFSKDHQYLCIFLVFVLPFLLVCLLAFLSKAEELSFVIYVVYFLVVIILANSKSRHIRKLEKKREEFLSIYYKGKYRDK